MKRKVIITVIILLLFVLSGCSAPKEKDLPERIRESPAARLVLPDGTETVVDSEITSLRSFADLNIKESPVEPADTENDWLYRIIFNPSEKVPGGGEIIVSFHKDYVQINTEYYLPAEGISCESILDWAKGKFDHFME